MPLNSNKKSSRKAKILPQFSIYSGNKPLLDLLEIQRKSFFDLLERGIIQELSKTDTFRETTKNSGFTQKLELVFNPETYKLVSPNCTPKQAILKGKTYAGKLYVQATLTIRSLPRESAVEIDTNKTPKNEKVFDLLSRKTKQKNCIDYVKKESSNAVADFASLSLPLLFPEGCLSPPNGLGKYNVNDNSFVNISSSLVNQKYSGVSQMQNSGNEKNVTKHQRIFTKSSDFLTPFVNNFPSQNVVSRENKKHILKLNMRVNVDFVKSAILLSRFTNSASQNLSTSFENISFFPMINGMDQINGGNKSPTSFITPSGLKADTFGVLRSTFFSFAATPPKGGVDNEKNNFLTDSKEHKNLSISQETVGLKEQRKAHRNLTKISPLLRNLEQPVSSLSFVNCCERNKLQAQRVFDLKDPFGVFSLTGSTPLVNYSNDEEKLDFVKKVPTVHFSTVPEKGSNRSFLIGLLKTRLFESLPGKESKTESKITRSTATFLGTPNKIKEKIQQQKTHWLRQWKDSIKPASFTRLCVGSKASFLITKGVNNNNALLAGAKQGDKTANKEGWLVVAKQPPFAAKSSIVKNEDHKNAKNFLSKNRKVIPYNRYRTNVSPFWNETVDTSNYWQSLCSFPGIYSKGVRGNLSLLLSPSFVPLSGALHGKEVLLRTHNAVTPFGGYKKFCLFTPHYMQKEYKGQLVTPETPSGGKGSMQTSKIEYKSEIPFSFVNSYTSFARPTFVETPAIWNDLFYQKSRRYPVNVKFSLTPLSKLHLRGILKSQTKGSVNTSPTYWNQRKLFSSLSLTTPINCQVHPMLLKSPFDASQPKEITSKNFVNHTKKQTIKSGFDPLGKFNSLSPLGVGAASNPFGVNAGGLKVEDFNQLSDFIGDQISVTPGSVSQSSKQKDFTSQNTLALRFLQGEQTPTPLKGRKIFKNVSSGTPYPSGTYAAEQREQKKKDGDVKIFRPWIFLGELPLMTKRGHFILNGSPRVIVNQIARCAGIYFQEKRRGVGFEQEVRVSADLIPQRGPWLRIQSDWEGRFWARLKREGRVKYATLYEAFQEFEKEYSAPLVSLVTTSSSIFPKSEVFAFHERKAKEDRQKKALVRLFKNSTRYSLGKQGRSRINQRVHSQKVVPPAFILQKLEKGYPGGRGRNHAVSSLFEDSTNLIYTKNVRQFLTNKKPSFTSYAQLLGVAPTFLYQLPAFRDLLTTSISPLDFSQISTKPYPLTSKASKRGSELAKLLLSTKVTTASAFDQKFENSGKLHQLTDTNFLSKDYKDQTPWPLPFDWEIKNDVENVLMAADINAVHTYLEHLLEGQGFTDDIDHLKNRLVRTSGKLLQQQLELGLNRLNEVITPLLGNLIQNQLFSSLSSSLPGEGGQNTPISMTVKDPLLTSNEKSVSSFVDPGGVSSNKEHPMAHAESIGGVAKHARDLVTEADNFPTLTSTPYPPNPPEGGMNKEGGRVKGLLQKSQGEILPLTRKKQGRVVNLVVSNTKVGEREQANLKKKPLAAKQQIAASLPLMFLASKNSKKGKNKVTPGLRPYPSGLSSLESETPFRWLRTSKPVNNAFREFFGSNPLSQYMDQTNPLAEITHKRRLSSMGPGGIKRETAGMEVRGIHPTHYGRVCPIETPEGKNAGLVNSPTVYGRIGNNGFMETPLYQVLESQIQKERWTFFSAQQEEDEESSLATGDTGSTRFNLLSGEANVPIPVQTANNPLAHFQQVERNRVGYKALSPVQTISIATALIPFLEHDDANRALMGSNMQRQAIPLLSPERPIVGTGFEPMVTAESGQAVQATKMGCVSHVSANKIILQTIHSINPEGIRGTYSNVRDCEIGPSGYSRIHSGDSISNIYRTFFHTMERYNSIWWNHSTFKRSLEPASSLESWLRSGGSFKGSNKPFGRAKTFYLPLTPPEGRGKKKVTNSGALEVEMEECKEQRVTTNRVVAAQQSVSPFVDQQQRESKSTKVSVKSKTASLINYCYQVHDFVKDHNLPASDEYENTPGFSTLPRVKGKEIIRFLKSKKLWNFSKVFREKQNISRGLKIGNYLVSEPSFRESLWHVKKPFWNSFLDVQFVKNTFEITKPHASKATQKRARNEEKEQLFTHSLHALQPFGVPSTSFFTPRGSKIPLVGLMNNVSLGKTPGGDKGTNKEGEYERGNQRFQETIFAHPEYFIKPEAGANVIDFSLRRKNQVPFTLSASYTCFTTAGGKKIEAQRGNFAAPVTPCIPSTSKASDGLGNIAGDNKNKKRVSKELGKMGKNQKKADSVFNRKSSINYFDEIKEKEKASLYFQNKVMDKSMSTSSPFLMPPEGQLLTPLGSMHEGQEESIIHRMLHISNKIPHQTTTKLHLCSTQNSFIFKKVEQPLQIYQRSNQETCLSQRPLVQEGDWVQKGDFLGDCSASNSGDLALGKNVTVAYMPWEGYNFEDAIVISDRLVANDIYTSIHIERYEIKVSKNSQGKERITSQIPSLPSRRLKHLDNSGIARVSSWVQPGDILVGKVVELKRPLSPYERLAWELASRLSPTSPEREKWLSKVWLEDISLRLPPGVCGRVINFQVISTEWSDKEQLAHPLEVHVYLAVKRKIQVGDKLAGRHGNKGIVSIVLPRQDMPYLGDGSTVDMVLNPLGVPSRMNLGQIFECLLGLAGSQLGCNFKVTPFDEIAGGEASRSLVFLKLYQCRLIYKQQWLFTPTFPGKNKLFDGRTGEPFENWVTVGKAYMLKLIHMVDHKIHARSTGPYSLFTRQPVRGRSRRGGQRLGEMEVWAVEGFGAAYTLQEFLTIKSDDLKARAALQRSFYKQNDVTLGKVHISPGNPEAFKVLVSELQALCLHIQM